MRSAHSPIHLLHSESRLELAYVFDYSGEKQRNPYEYRKSENAENSRPLPKYFQGCRVFVSFPIHPYPPAHQGVKPTPGGRYFIDQLDALLDSYDSAVAGARQRSFTLAQTVRIGITSYMIHFVPQACRTAQPHFQNVRFDYVVCRLPETYQALDQDKIDIQLLADCSEPISIHLNCIPLFHCPNCCKIPRGHPFYGKETLRLADLAHQRVLTLPPSRTQNAARLDQILQSPALDIERIYFETPEQAEALSLAQKIPIMTLAFPSEKDCFSVALLKEDQAELEPLLNYFRAYFIRHQQDFLPLKPLISNMTA